MDEKANIGNSYVTSHIYAFLSWDMLHKAYKCDITPVDVSRMHESFSANPKWFHQHMQEIRKKVIKNNIKQDINFDY